MTPVIDATELKAADGSSVAIRTGPQGEVLETRDRAGRILFEYDAATGRAVIHLPGLEIASSRNGAELSAPRGLKIRSGGPIEIESPRSAKITCGQSRIELGPREIGISAPAANLAVSETAYEGDRITGRAREARFAWGRLEQIVGRLLVWAKDAYHRVEGLFHSRAGRIRTEARETLHFQGERATVVAEGDVRIQGKTINLG